MPSRAEKRREKKAFVKMMTVKAGLSWRKLRKESDAPADMTLDERCVVTCELGRELLNCAEERLKAAR